MLGSSEGPLCTTYDVAMLDLDGVVYVGAKAVEGAPGHLAQVRGAGMRCAFITNNASRPPGEVAEHLRRLGVEAEAADVVTSAQAAARLLSERLEPGAAVALLGASGLGAALAELGLRPVDVADRDAQAIVSGYGPEVLWRDVMRAGVRIRDGLWWVASNADATIPTAYGVAPGHGLLVETLQRFSGVAAVVAGKPERPLLDETVRRVGGERPLMVGDRLDTDIEGAHNAGMDSLLVLTGVTGLEELAAATTGGRPTYISPDLRGLLEPQPAPKQHDGRFRCGSWTAYAERGLLHVEGDGSVADWWRAVVCAAWRHLDDTGAPADVAGLVAGSLRP